MVLSAPPVINSCTPNSEEQETPAEETDRPLYCVMQLMPRKCWVLGCIGARTKLIWFEDVDF